MVMVIVMVIMIMTKTIKFGAVQEPLTQNCITQTKLSKGHQIQL